jgi:hypothetical protein
MKQTLISLFFTLLAIMISGCSSTAFTTRGIPEDAIAMLYVNLDSGEKSKSVAILKKALANRSEPIVRELNTMGVEPLEHISSITAGILPSPKDDPARLTLTSILRGDFSTEKYKSSVAGQKAENLFRVGNYDFIRQAQDSIFCVLDRKTAILVAVKRTQKVQDALTAAAIETLGALEGEAPSYSYILPANLEALRIQTENPLLLLACPPRSLNIPWLKRLPFAPPLPLTSYVVIGDNGETAKLRVLAECKTGADAQELQTYVEMGVGLLKIQFAGGKKKTATALGTSIQKLLSSIKYEIKESTLNLRADCSSEEVSQILATFENTPKP